MKIQTKRVYDPALKEDGFRVLVDRIWPRGMSRDKLRVELWLKEAAPGTPLRKWFGHDPTRWAAFRDRYFSELDNKPEAVQQLLELAAKGRLTLLFSTSSLHPTSSWTASGMDLPFRVVFASSRKRHLPGRCFSASFLAHSETMIFVPNSLFRGTSRAKIFISEPITV